jgi:hypothetical protein
MPDRGPLEVLGKRMLKEYIDVWACEAPEDFWMDGEYEGTYDERVKELMEHYLSMNHDDQMKVYEMLKEFHDTQLEFEEG